MTKRQLIDRITTINVSAHPSFLASFGEDDLQAYLEHLRVLQQPRLPVDRGRFESCLTPASKPQFVYDAPQDADTDKAAAPARCDEHLSADELDSYQPPQLDVRSEDYSSSPERPLAPVMAGARQGDESSATAADDSDTWLF